MARRTPTPPPTSTCQLAVQHTTCASCGTPLYIAHHTHRTIRRLDGVWRLTMPLMRCLNSHCASFRKLCRPEDEDHWLDPDMCEPEEITSLLRPYPADLMMASRA
jgi:hypothetical protein